MSTLNSDPPLVTGRWADHTAGDADGTQTAAAIHRSYSSPSRTTRSASPRSRSVMSTRAPEWRTMNRRSADVAEPVAADAG